MKTLLKTLALFVVIGCSNQADFELEAQTLYEQIKAIPLSKPCENLKGYQDLNAMESINNTNLFTQLSISKIEEYSVLCKTKKENDALKERLAKVKDNMHILGYVTGALQEEYECKNFFESEQDGFYCPINKKPSDRIFLSSDPYTKMVGTITRYILIDKEQVPYFKDKMKDNYGEPELMVLSGRLDLTKTALEILLDDVWGWGNVKEKRDLAGYNWIVKDREFGKWLTLRFQKCTNIWFTDNDCPGLFDIDENPSKYIAIITLRGDESILNEEANRLKRDPRKEKEYQTIETDDIEDINF